MERLEKDKDLSYERQLERNFNVIDEMPFNQTVIQADSKWILDRYLAIYSKHNTKLKETDKISSWLKLLLFILVMTAETGLLWFGAL